MNKPRTDKAKRLAAEGTYLGTVAGVPFYEHPTLGDESPLLFIDAEGKARLSDFWELPELSEFVELAPANAIHATESK